MIRINTYICQGHLLQRRGDADRQDQLPLLVPTLPAPAEEEHQDGLGGAQHGVLGTLIFAKIYNYFFEKKNLRYLRVMIQKNSPGLGDLNRVCEALFESGLIRYVISNSSNLIYLF